jgi:hypothetical protein
MIMQPDDRFPFHQEPGHEVEDNNGPESGKKKQNNHDGPCPEDGKIEIICNASANSHDDPASGSIKSSVITYTVKSSHDVRLLLS